MRPPRPDGWPEKIVIFFIGIVIIIIDIKNLRI